MPEKFRYIICFEFLGTDFFGSQKQPDKRTVQGEIEKALCTLTKDKITTIFSGRTDAKVSAKFQVAHFDLGFKIKDIQKFLYHINCILPDDIKIFDIKKVNPTFHCQKDAKYKHYRYSILNSHVASAFNDCYLFYPYKKLNIDRINESLSYLVGYHDFSAFKSKSDNPYNDCMIYFAKAQNYVNNWQNFIFIDIVGNRFLYNMVRTIVGQILFIERNDLNPNLIEIILSSKDRTKTANVISAKGLTLEYVGYDNVNDYKKTISSKGR